MYLGFGIVEDGRVMGLWITNCRVGGGVQTRPCCGLNKSSAGNSNCAIVTEKEIVGNALHSNQAALSNDSNFAWLPTMELEEVEPNSTKMFRSEDSVINSDID